MQGYLVMWNGQKMKVNANSTKHAAHLRLLEVPMPRSGCVTVCHQETEDSEVTAEIFYLSDRKCKVCGCTERKACPGGCAWADWDLCTRCLPRVAAGMSQKQEKTRFFQLAGHYVQVGAIATILQQPNGDVAMVTVNNGVINIDAFTWETMREAFESVIDLKVIKVSALVKGAS